eukprot:8411350-Lingulodinium_polyedra.AAC.1
MHGACPRRSCETQCMFKTRCILSRRSAFCQDAWSRRDVGTHYASPIKCPRQFSRCRLHHSKKHGHVQD